MEQFSLKFNTFCCSYNVFGIHFLRMSTKYIITARFESQSKKKIQSRILKKILFIFEERKKAGIGVFKEAYF